MGKQGFFDNGTCNALTGDYASESPNCFKDTTMTVYDKDGKAIYTTRSLPLSSQSESKTSDGMISLSVKVPDTPNGDEKKLFDVSLNGNETKTYSIPASYGYGFVTLRCGNYDPEKKDCVYSSQGGGQGIVCRVHNAVVSMNHDTSTVTIVNVSTDIGYSWNGGAFTHPDQLNTTAYFVPHTKAHTETREFTLKELLQLVVDNHISA